MARVSMNELTTYRWSFEEDVHHYQAAGFEGIGIWREKLADFGEEKGADLLAEAGLAVSTISWAGGFTGSDGRSHADAIEDGLDAVRLAAQLRAECLLVHSGARGGHTKNHVRRLFRGALEKMLNIAEPLGITLAIEPMHRSCASDWTFLEGLDEALTLLDSFKSPRLKLAFDCYHLGHDDAILGRLAGLAKHLAIVQLGDARHAPRGEQNRCRLGDGVLDLAGIVGTLLDAGYDGFFDVELIGEEIETGDYQELLTHSRQAFDDLVNSTKAG
jgi:sugar phosphate isomerase/epimerase